MKFKLVDGIWKSECKTCCSDCSGYCGEYCPLDIEGTCENCQKFIERETGLFEKDKIRSKSGLFDSGFTTYI
ncbi:hypothetical protein ACV3Z5_14165 [Clostridium perfringens]